LIARKYAHLSKQGFRRLHHDREARELVADELDRLAVVQLHGEEVGVEEDVADLEGVTELEAAGVESGRTGRTERTG
jgi:hypothetical protein